MAIKDYEELTPLADADAKARAIGNIEKEYQTRLIGDSEAAACAYLQLLGLHPSAADRNTAIEKRDRARYDELRVLNPFDAVDYARKNPHVYKHGADTVNTSLRMAQSRALEGRLASGSTFEGAAERVAADRAGAK